MARILTSATPYAGTAYMFCHSLIMNRFYSVSFVSLTLSLSPQQFNVTYYNAVNEFDLLNSISTFDT